MSNFNFGTLIGEGSNADNDDGETKGAPPPDGETKGTDANADSEYEVAAKKPVGKQTARKGRHRSILDKMRMCEEWKAIQSIQHKKTKMERETKFDEERFLVADGEACKRNRATTMKNYYAKNQGWAKARADSLIDANNTAVPSDKGKRTKKKPLNDLPVWTVDIQDHGTILPADESGDVLTFQLEESKMPGRERLLNAIENMMEKKVPNLGGAESINGAYQAVCHANSSKRNNPLRQMLKALGHKDTPQCEDLEEYACSALALAGMEKSHDLLHTGLLTQRKNERPITHRSYQIYHIDQPLDMNRVEGSTNRWEYIVQGSMTLSKSAPTQVYHTITQPSPTTHEGRLKDFFACLQQSSNEPIPDGTKEYFLNNDFV